MGSRSKPPRAIESAVLLQSRRKCCLCFFLDDEKSRKNGQLAHIDHNRENHLFDNLVFLCLNHHDEYDGKTSQSKGITVAEMRQYRDQLYAAVAEQERQADAQDPKPRNIIPFSSFHTQAGNSSTVINAAGDVNLHPKFVKKNIVQAGPNHLSEAQAKEIRDRVFELAQFEAESGRTRNVGKWYNKLYKQFDVTSYKLIPAKTFEETISWLQQQAALLLPKLRRTNNPEWRKSLYTGIWARADEVGMRKEAVYDLAARILEMRHPPESLTELGERQLKTLHDTLFRCTRT